ncbi:MAG: hypothetical protein H3C28_04165 [Sphingomonadales bacterium]|nr:hypothetical protein [Sphingomonadales bacterium]
MPIANIDEVQSVLSDFESRIYDVVNRAWNDWKEMPGRGRFMFGRTRSNIIFDCICQYAAIEFADDPDIHIIGKNGTLKFLFRDRVLVRFKKENAKGIGSNILTQSVLDFVDPQLTIPGLPDVYKVEACYKTDGLGTQFEQLAIVARDRTRRIWSYPIDGSLSDVKIVHFPDMGGPDATPPSVTPKKRPLEDEASE